MVRGAHGEDLHIAFPPCRPCRTPGRGKEGKEAEGEAEGVDVRVLEGRGGVEVQGMPRSMTGKGDRGRGIVQVLHFWKGDICLSSSFTAGAGTALAGAARVAAALLPVVRQLRPLCLCLGFHPYNNTMGLLEQRWYVHGQWREGGQGQRRG